MILNQKRKSRIIINIQALNKIIISNIYLIFSQVDIFIMIKDVISIFIIKVINFYY